jgi:hypothetical protein
MVPAEVGSLREGRAPERLDVDQCPELTLREAIIGLVPLLTYDEIPVRRHDPYSITNSVRTLVDDPTDRSSI